MHLVKKKVINFVNELIDDESNFSQNLSGNLKKKQNCIARHVLFEELQCISKSWKEKLRKNE